MKEKTSYALSAQDACPARAPARRAEKMIICIDRNKQ